MNANDWNYHFQLASKGKCPFKVVEPECGNIKNTDELILKLAEINLKYALNVAKLKLAYCEKWLSHYEQEMETYPNVSKIMCEYHSSEIRKFQKVYSVSGVS